MPPKTKNEEVKPDSVEEEQDKSVKDPMSKGRKGKKTRKKKKDAPSKASDSDSDSDSSSDADSASKEKEKKKSDDQSSTNVDEKKKETPKPTTSAADSTAATSPATSNDHQTSDPQQTSAIESMIPPPVQDDDELPTQQSPGEQEVDRTVEVFRLAPYLESVDKFIDIQAILALRGLLRKGNTETHSHKRLGIFVLKDVSPDTWSESLMSFLTNSAEYFTHQQFNSVRQLGETLVSNLSGDEPPPKFVRRGDTAMTFIMLEHEAIMWDTLVNDELTLDSSLQVAEFVKKVREAIGFAVEPVDTLLSDMDIMPTTFSVNGTNCRFDATASNGFKLPSIPPCTLR